MSKDKLIPDLRFPEFKNEGKWFGDTLINIAKFRRGSFPQPYGLPEWYDDVNGMPFIQVYDVADNFRLKQKTKSKISKLAAELSVFIPKGTVIITIQGSIGRVAITQYDAYIDRTLLLFEEFYNEIDKTFFAYVLFMLFEIEKEKAPGGIIKTITKEVLSDFVVNVPKLPEQQKIATCLSSLDELIAAHSQKLVLLKDHKKGLMQNLFPDPTAGSGGEKVPNYRFKEFEKDGEWVETCVEDNCLVKGRIGYRGYTTEDLVGQGEGALVLGGKHIQNQLLALKDPTYLSWEKYYESPEIMVEVGDIIFSQRGTLGDCAIIDREIGPATINPSMVLLKNITCDARFLYYILISDRIQIEVRKNRAMGAIPMLSQKQIKEFPFLIPSNPKEQQKIASCLSSLDALITAQSEKIEQLKWHKKGLMQGMFPKIND